MGDDKSGPEEAVKGTVEGVKGKVKEAGGAVLGRDDLTERARPSRTKPTPNAMLARRKPKLSRRGPAPTPPKSVRRRTNSHPRGAPSDFGAGPFPRRHASDADRLIEGFKPPDRDIPDNALTRVAAGRARCADELHTSVSGVVAFLRASYAKGAPDVGYGPLLALLPRRVTDDEVTAIARKLLAVGRIDNANVGVAIIAVTDAMPARRCGACAGGDEIR